MDNEIKYRILTGVRTDVLEKEVTEYLNKGWKLSGSMAAIAEGNHQRYCQPVSFNHKSDGCSVN